MQPEKPKPPESKSSGLSGLLGKKLSGNLGGALAKGGSSNTNTAS